MNGNQKQPGLALEGYVSGVLAGDRGVLSRAITLVESRLPAHQELAQRVLEHLLPHSGRSLRVGITGPPGVGKSCLIEALGSRLTAQGHKLAVLAVDPSSPLSGGSVLGDKTRMPLLSCDERAFVRPSPAGAAAGGVARATREAVVLVEAAGHDVVLVETVGVGQGEATVRSMVDFFLLLVMAGSGDELQGIKRGLMELADALVITKADGDNLQRAMQTQAEFKSAVSYLAPPLEGWQVPVLTCSAVTGASLDELWKTVLAHRELGERSGALARLRQTQALHWMRATIADRLEQQFYDHLEVVAALPQMEQDVLEGRMLPAHAALRLLELCRPKS